MKDYTHYRIDSFEEVILLKDDKEVDRLDLDAIIQFYLDEIYNKTEE